MHSKAEHIFFSPFTLQAMQNYNTTTEQLLFLDSPRTFFELNLNKFHAVSIFVDSAE
jgi:hypothetical protein